MSVGDSFCPPEDVPNLQTAEIVKNDIFIRSGGLLVKLGLNKPLQFIT